MRCVRIEGICRVRHGVAPGPGEALWVCAHLDADLDRTGRTVVALGPAGLQPGELVAVAESAVDSRGFDLVVRGRVADLGATDRAAPSPVRRVWLRGGNSRGPSVQRQNRH